MADGPIGHMSPLPSPDFVRGSEVDALVHADIDDVISHVGKSVISDRSVRRRAEDREGCLVAQQMRERTCQRPVRAFAPDVYSGYGGITRNGTQFGSPSVCRLPSAAPC